MHRSSFINESIASRGNFFISSATVYTAIENILSFLSVSSLWVGGLGFFKTYIVYILLGVNPSISICGVVFLVTFCIYSLDKIVDIDKDIISVPQRYGFLYRRKKLILSIAIAAYVVAVAVILWEMPIALPIIFIPFIANAFYGTRLIKGMPRLKDIPVMKNIVVAVSWASVTVLLPAQHLSNSRAGPILMALYFMLMKTFIDTILYDIRDIKGDRENNVRTMATLLGERKTILVLLSVNSTLILWLAGANKAVWPLGLAFILYGYIYISYFRKRRNPLALDFFVEGQWLLISLALMAFWGCCGQL